MPVTVRRVPDEPIVIATMTGTVTLADTEKVFRRTDELRADMPPRIYRITDVTQATSTVAEIIRIVKAAADVKSSHTADPTLTVVFVGISQWSKLFTDAMGQDDFGMVDIPIFDTVDDALVYVRRRINDDATDSANDSNGKTA